MAWTEIRLNQQWERMLGFTLPVDGKVIVISYGGLFTYYLDNPQSVEEDQRYPEGGELYDWHNQVLRYGGDEYRVIGLYGGRPVTESPYGEVLMLDTLRDILHIKGRDAVSTSEHRYCDASGDWAVATFSDDFRFALVGVPYDLFAFRRV